MLRVSVELIPEGNFRSKSVLLGYLDIVNDKTGNTELGNYLVKTNQEETFNSWRGGIDRSNFWNVVFECMKAAIPRERTKLRAIKDEYREVMWKKVELLPA